MGSDGYVHGYSEREGDRLMDQSVTLVELLHHDTGYEAGSLVLEAGCGVGAQTVLIAERSPGAKIVSVDISAESVGQAKKRVAAKGFSNVEFHTADIFDLPFEEESFDHVFLCFVLEHLPNPDKALETLKRMVRKGGTITLIEGDHGSTFFYPRSDEAMHNVQCLVDLQAESGGNALIGRELYPLLDSAGFTNVEVSPRMVYVDSSRPELVEGFTKKTFAAMVEGRDG